MKTYGQFCGLARALDHVGDRWTLLIVRELLLGAKRFTDLRAGLSGIAANLLSQRLLRLEADGIVARRWLPAPAASTVYELTEFGLGLRASVESLIRWGGRWMSSGVDGDAFSMHWLALALQALGVGAEGRPVVLHLETNQGSVRLLLGDGRVRISPDEATPPDVSVRADPGLILGLAAGALDLDTALAGAGITTDTPESVERLRRIFIGSR